MQKVVPTQECRAVAHKLHTVWLSVANPVRRHTALDATGIDVRRSPIDSPSRNKSWSRLFFTRAKVMRISVLLMKISIDIVIGIAAYIEES